MPDTPPLASLLDQWTRGTQGARFEVYAHLRADPAAAGAIEHALRDHLTDKLPVARVRAAEAVLHVYGDAPAARAALAGALRTGEPSAAASAAVLVRQLPAPLAAPVLADLALHAPKVYHEQTAEFVRWAGETAARAGTGFRELLNHTDAERESELLIGLAVAAPSAEHPLCDLEPDLKARLFHTGPGYAAGAALWRVSWRVNREWLSTLNPDSPRLAGNVDLLRLLVDVVCEHLGRRPELVPLARALVVRLAAEAPGAVPSALARVERLGTRGWAVLLPLLGAPAVGADARARLFRSAASTPLRALAQHHAQAVIAERLAHPATAAPALNDLLAGACELLAALGPAAGFALPQLLELAALQPHAVPHAHAAIRALAPGYPLARAAVARALSRVRARKGFDPVAFGLLAGALAELDPDAGPALANDPSIDSRVPDSLLQHEAWARAAPAARAKHARYLADLLASPRAEPRARAAELLRHYADQLPLVWPALVAALAGSDERAARAVLSLFRHLAPVAGAVEPDLLELFGDPCPIRAARAAVALWRLGRFAAIVPHIRRELLGAPDDSRGWDLLTALANRVGHAHGVLHAIEGALAGAPDDTRARLWALLFPPETGTEAAISACVDAAAAPGARVKWLPLFRAAGDDPEAGLLALALMCAYGSEGTGPVKINLIKHQRAVAFHYLAESKLIVERAMERLTAGASATERRARVREFCGNPERPPEALLALLTSEVNWYRWAGLELLDAWGAPELAADLIAERVWDRCPRVRARALLLT